jgi:hypothetical protein
MLKDREDHTISAEHIPEHVFEKMECQLVHELGLCTHCPADWRCHILWETHVKGTCEKLCPILFCDVVKPPWTVEDLC